MLGLGKFFVSSLKLCNDGAKLLPKCSPLLRNMETFSPVWESDISSAMKKAKHLKKPVMLVVYRPWCTYCQYLSRQIASSSHLKQMEPFFVMAQVNEDETYLDSKFAPDGGVRYVPRVLFLTPEGEVMKDVRNHKSYKDGAVYVYNEVKEIMESMNEVVKKYFMVSASSDDKNTPKASDKTEKQTVVRDARGLIVQPKNKKLKMKSATRLRKK